ncbi:hypothetical protein JCM17960_01380 [Magnetospira thiophila]
MVQKMHSYRNPHDRSIVYHFDVDQHSLPLKQFVDTANATLSIVENFNEELFDGKGKFELRVITPEPGGLIELLELVVVVGGPVWVFLSTDIGKAYIKGLTGHEPAHWADQLGRLTRKIGSRDDGPPPDVMGFLTALPKDDVAAQTKSMELEAAILAELIIRFLETHADQLEKIGFTKRKFRKAYSAKNRVYQACVDNREVKALGFDRSEHFGLKRADFPKFIEQLPDEEITDPEPPHSWTVEIVDVLANSPNWLRDGRKWQGKTDKYKDIAFSIEDEAFWHHVKVKDIEADIGDNMRVQWAFPTSPSKPSNVRVLKVLTFNGREIAKPLIEQELQEILEEVSLREPDMPSLFDHAEETDKKTDERGGQNGA